MFHCGLSGPGSVAVAGRRRGRQRAQALAEQHPVHIGPAGQPGPYRRAAVHLQSVDQVVRRVLQVQPVQVPPQRRLAAVGVANQQLVRGPGPLVPARLATAAGVDAGQVGLVAHHHEEPVAEEPRLAGADVHRGPGQQERGDGRRGHPTPDRGRPEGTAAQQRERVHRNEQQPYGGRAGGGDRGPMRNVPVQQVERHLFGVDKGERAERRRGRPATGPTTRRRRAADRAARANPSGGSTTIPAKCWPLAAQAGAEQDQDHGRHQTADEDQADPGVERHPGEGGQDDAGQPADGRGGRGGEQGLQDTAERAEPQPRQQAGQSAGRRETDRGGARRRRLDVPAEHDRQHSRGHGE